MARVGKACQMERVLMGGSGNDGIDFATEGEPDCYFDRVTGDAAGADGAMAVLARIAATQFPGSNCYPPSGWDRGDLVFRTHYSDLGFERFGQRGGRNLRADAPWVAQRNRQPRPDNVPVCPSRLSRRFRPSAQDLIST